MFKAPFSFEGRIRRTELGLSIIFYVIIAVILSGIVGINEEASVLLIAYVPLLWFIWAQSAKRCHDLGNSGWWQLIPFYGFWLLFADGDNGQNNYGENPKNTQGNKNQYQQGSQAYSNKNNTSSSSTYSGGYNGGHNNPNKNDMPIVNSNYEKKQNGGEYNSGDLYN